MKPELQIKALAELDGWTEYERARGIYFKAGFSGGWIPRGGVIHTKRKEMNLSETSNLLPDYLNSYDAIIPLIQKQSDLVQNNIVGSFKDEELWWSMTPPQLAEALLRATNKWIEE